MRHLLLKRIINLFCRFVLRFLHRSVWRAMRSFFDCFRWRNRNDNSTSNLAPNSSRIKSRPWSNSLSALSALSFSKEKAPSRALKREESFGSDAIHTDKSFKDDSFMTNAQNNGRTSPGFSDADEEGLGNIETECRATPMAANVPGRIRYVRFESEVDQSYTYGSSRENSSRKPEMTVNTNYVVTSPNPTPLKLSDEMQTPGTVFPVDPHLAGRGRPGIRSQFVSPVSKLIENASLSKVSKELVESTEQAKMQVCNEHIEIGTPNAGIYERQGGEVSHGTFLKSEVSLSSWLKHWKEDSSENVATSPTTKTPRVSVSPGDKPIIGMVSAHWNQEQLSQISPKWRDGNGIPNSTTKDKEDQKVCWHTTPFEERLEKALSEESSISQRKPCSGEIGTMEEAERETTISQLQHSPRSKSVVSY